ncbi:hypothetical protein BKI52_12495 [marine bacterium AO1-C]|nr:hypothetical protein BKI52_12495 [marine bacterium AO1-C]
MKELYNQIKEYYLNDMSQGDWRKALALYQQLPQKFQDRKLLDNFIRGISIYKLIDTHFNIWKGILNRMEYAINGSLSQDPKVPEAKTEESNDSGNTEESNNAFFSPQQEETELEEPVEETVEDLEALKAEFSNQLNALEEGEEHDEERQKLVELIMKLELEITEKKKAENLTDDQKALQDQLEEAIKERRNAASNRRKWEKQKEAKLADEASIDNSFEEIETKIKFYDDLHKKHDEAVDDLRKRINS